MASPPCGIGALPALVLAPALPSKREFDPSALVVAAVLLLLVVFDSSRDESFQRADGKFAALVGLLGRAPFCGCRCAPASSTCDGVGMSGL